MKSEESFSGQQQPPEKSQSKMEELAIFLFLTLVLAPAVAVICVGGYGFLVWMSQLVLGPPTG